MKNIPEARRRGLMEGHVRTALWCMREAAMLHSSSGEGVYSNTDALKVMTAIEACRELLQSLERK